MNTTSKAVIIAALLLPNAGVLADSGPVTAAYTASGSSAGDKRPCEFFQINNQSQWFAIPLTNLGANAQIVKIEKAAEQYLLNPGSPAAVVSFFTFGGVPNCDNFPIADGVYVGTLR